MKKSGNMRSNSENSEPETFKPKQGRKGDPKKAQEFIIKLFDRTINLSELDGSTPLYKICHDWITSSNNMILVRSQPKKPARQLEREEERDSDVLEKLKTEEISVVYSMPPFDKSIKMKQPMETDEEEDEERKRNLDSIMLFNEDLEEFSKENLLAEHKLKWKQKKDEWIRNREEFNEKKYSESLELLEYLYKPF